MYNVFQLPLLVAAFLITGGSALSLVPAFFVPTQNGDQSALLAAATASNGPIVIGSSDNAIKLIDSRQNGYTYAYAPTIFQDDAQTWQMYYCSSGTNGGWDSIRHATSTDLVHWSKPDVVLQISNNVSERAACDPSVVYYDAGDGPYYYLFYSGNKKDVGTVNFVARATKPTGPFLKYTERGTWEAKPADPKIIQTPITATKDKYGLGQPTVVNKNGVLYMWYTDTTNPDVPGGRQYVTSTTNPTSWPPAQITNKAVTSIDVKYDVVNDQFVMFANKSGTDASILIRTSKNGVTWTDVWSDPNPATTSSVNGDHGNIGVSGDKWGHLIPGTTILFGFPQAWGTKGVQWDLYGRLLHISIGEGPIDNTPPNVPPVGKIDEVSQDGVVTGWAADPNDAAASIGVHLFVDGPSGTGTGFAVVANASDVASPGYAGSHGIKFKLPSTIPNGQHTLYAYGLDTAQGSNTTLLPYPLTFTLKRSAAPQPSTACSFNGSTIQSGSSVTAYASSNGQTCVSQVRVCNNGVLSGSYAVATCTPTKPPTPTPTPTPTPVPQPVPSTPTPTSKNPPQGSLDTFTSDARVTGWAFDPDARNAALKVRFYLDGPSGVGAPLATVTAALPPPAENRAGNHESVTTKYVGNHGFNFVLPTTVPGGTHQLYAYALDATTNAETPLTGSPRSVKLSRPTTPAPETPSTPSTPSTPTSSGGITARASRVWEGNAAQGSVDTNPSTYWNSGRFAPQWIEFDLGSNTTLSSMNLTVEQKPDGTTTHEIYAGSQPNPTTLVKTLSGTTKAHQTLRVTFASPIQNVRYVRIVTTKSPSWVAWGTVTFNQAAVSVDDESTLAVDDIDVQTPVQNTQTSMLANVWSAFQALLESLLH